MKVTAKLMMCVLTTTVLVTFVNAFIAIRSDDLKFHSDATSEAERFAEEVEATISRAWRESGIDRMIKLLEEHQVSSYNLRVRWVWFDQQADSRFRPALSTGDLPKLTPRRAVSVQVSDIGGDRLHTYWPVSLDDRMGGLEFVRSMDELANRRRATILRTAGLMGSILAVGGVAMWLSGVVFVGKPLRKLITKTRSIAGGDLSSPLNIHSNDEMGELATSLNDMCTRLRDSQEQLEAESNAKIAAVEQLRHSDRLRTVGRLASGVAHELGTPLNVVSGRAEMIAEGGLTAEEIAASAQAIRHESRRMADLIQRLLDFARRKTPEKKMTDLMQLVTNTAQLIEPIAKKSQVELTVTERKDPCPVEIDAAQIQQVFTNVIVNAIQSMPHGGRVTINVAGRQTRSEIESDAEDFVVATIKDSGIGISDDQLDQIFEPFFTTKETGEGTGLGLSIAQRIVEEHGGRIEVDSNPGTSTTFSIFLPCGATT